MCPKGTCLFRVYYLPIERSREKELDSSQPDLIWFRDQRTTYIVNCSHFRSPLSSPFLLLYHLPPRALPLSRFHSARFYLSDARACAFQEHALWLKLREEASAHGSFVCPFNRPRVKWTFVVYNALNRLATKYYLSRFTRVEIDIIGGYLNREIGQHCWHVNCRYHDVTFWKWRLCTRVCVCGCIYMYIYIRQRN